MRVVEIVVDMLEDYIKFLESAKARNFREATKNEELHSNNFRIMSQTLEEKQKKAEQLVDKLKEDLNILNPEDEEGIKYV